MIDNEFVVDYVHLLYYKCHKINRNCNRSYIDSPDCIKDKQAAINPINKKDNKCFQYAVTVALNHEETEKHFERITKIKPFINKYNWERINFPIEYHLSEMRHDFEDNTFYGSKQNSDHF